MAGNAAVPAPNSADTLIDCTRGPQPPASRYGLGKLQAETGVGLTDRPSKTSCTSGLFGTGYTMSADIRDIRDTVLSASNYSGVGEKHGVSLVQEQGRSQFAGFSTDVIGYGAWMDRYEHTSRQQRTWRGIMVGGTDINGSLR